MQNFRELQVWSKSHQLTMSLYRSTTRFPPAELYGLTSQIRRSSASIPTNIAEGCGRDTASEFSRFIVIAMGSASELEYQLLLARDLNYLSQQDYEALMKQVWEVKKMLVAFHKRLKTVSENAKDVRKKSKPSLCK